MVDGKPIRCPLDIPRDERPQVAGIPRRAWDWLATVETASKTADAPQGSLTLVGLSQAYLSSQDALAASGELSRGQLQGIASRAKLFLQHTPRRVRSAPAADYTVNHLAELFQVVRASYSPHYVAGIGRTIRAAFRWGAKAVPGRRPVRLLAENPLAGYDFPRAPKRVRDYLEGSTVRRFYRWCWSEARRRRGLDRRFDRLFVLSLWFQRLTGCRPGEACGLLWADIDWAAGLATIPKERHKSGRKTGRDRTIYLGGRAVRLLRTIQGLPGRHETHVFTHMRARGSVGRGHYSPVAGEPWPSGSSASAKVRRLRDAAIAAGVAGVEAVGARKLVAYQNRHGYASDAIALGKTHEQTAAILGNTAAVVASTYAHPVVEAEAELARELDRRRRG